MKIYENVEDTGQTIIIIDRQEGRDLVAALEIATADQKELRQMKALPKSARAYKVSQEIIKKLPVF